MFNSVHKILIVYTGGTIGMVKDRLGFLTPSSDLIEDRILRIVMNLRDSLNREIKVDFEFLNPLIDSSSITPALWPRIARSLSDKRRCYDSFIILHGTDTMSFTAAMLNLMLPGFGKSVILTGSIFPFSKVASDAADNIADAVTMSMDARFRGVYLVFGRKLWMASHIKKADSVSVQAFTTPGKEALFNFENDLPETNLPRIDQLRDFNLPKMDSTLKIATFIFAPGTTVTCICEQLEADFLEGVILQSYGLGNIPSNPRLLSAISSALDHGTVIVNASQSLRPRVDMSVYSSGGILAGLGVWSAQTMNVESTLAKLYLTLSRTDLNIEEKLNLWNQDWAGELK